MLSTALVLTLVEALDESQVVVKERRRVLTDAPPTVEQLDSIDRGALTRTETADLARLEARFVARARRVGIETQSGLSFQQTDAFQRALSGASDIPHERRSVSSLGGEDPSGLANRDRPAGIAITKRRVGTTTSWVFTTNRLSTFSMGTDCCPRCYGDCSLCQARNCTSVTTGTQLIVTFTVEGRVLVREDALVQTIEPPAPPDPDPLELLVEGTAVKPLQKSLNAQRDAFDRCVGPTLTDALVFEGVWDSAANGRGRLLEVTAVGGQEPFSPCLLVVLGRMKVPAPTQRTDVVFRFRRKTSEH